MHSSRIGMRDEYHGYLSTGLAVMNADGSDIHCIGFNLGRDTDPVIAHDGRVLFTRLELFYSRMKNELNVESCFPDGTNLRTLYGPERRDFWTSLDYVWSRNQPRHRALHMSQPQSLPGGRFLINSFEGPILVDGPHDQRIIQQDNTMAITTPYPLGDGRLLVAAGKRPFKKDRKTGEVKKDKQGKPVLHLHHWVDHGLHYMDMDTGELELIYNDPETSEFEARPLRPRHVPPVLAESPTVRSGAYTGRVYCRSVFNTRHPAVKERGRYVRIVEGLPTIARHQTHRGRLYWKNHGGATGRVWATVPLADDGSFSLEVPADRFFHFQVLDSNRRVVGNELIWQYVRPGESKGCVGCHEPAFQADPPPLVFPKATERAPIGAVPTGGEIRYRAKMWYKGDAPWEREERMRTVNSANIIGRQ
jgi:hypothetical protein